MAVKRVDRSFLQGQQSVVNLFSAAIKTSATCGPYERRLIGVFRKNNDAESLNVFVEFTK